MDPEHESNTVEVEKGVMDDGIKTEDQSDLYAEDERYANTEERYADTAEERYADTAEERYAETAEERYADTAEERYAYSADERYAETDDVTVMDTQTGDVIEMAGEVCSMDMESVDIGCKDSPPLPDKAARDQSDETNIVRAKDQDEFLQKSPERRKFSKDSSWQNDEMKNETEEKAPPIPIKRGNTKRRIEMFEAI